MHKKGRITCGRCRKKFEQRYYKDEVCPQCADELPKCSACHCTMGRLYGFMEDFAEKVGKYSLCTSCSAELKRKKEQGTSPDDCSLTGKLART